MSAAESEAATPPPSAALPVRPLITDDRLITLGLRSINADLTCRVCLGMIQNATAVMECLHRFCQECIETSLRIGRKQCPTCRVHCPSRRSLRRDPLFDQLIAAVCPNIAKAEAEQEALVKQLLENRAKQLTESLEKGHLHQTQRKAAMPRPIIPSKSKINEEARARKRSRAGSSDESSAESDADKEQDDEDEDEKEEGSPSQQSESEPEVEHVSPSSKRQRPLEKPESKRNESVTRPSLPKDAAGNPIRKAASDGISFCLNRDPAERTLPALVKRFLRTTRAMTVRHLQKYLSLKLNLLAPLPEAYVASFSRDAAASNGGAESGVNGHEKPDPEECLLPEMIDITVKSGTNSSVIPSHLTLDEVEKQYWLPRHGQGAAGTPNVRPAMLLHYSLRGFDSFAASTASAAGSTHSATLESKDR